MSSIFEFPTDEARAAYDGLANVLNKTEPCYLGDADEWTENYTGRPIPQEVAERLCGGCHAIEECLAYALKNPQETAIWGGTTNATRKEMRLDNADGTQ